jgi:hypothetical protein
VSAGVSRYFGKLWPSTLRARLFLILFAGLIVAYGLSFSILFIERYMSAKAVMLGTLENDLATSIAILDRLPAGERADWLDRLSRGNYRLVLGPGVAGVPEMSGRGAEIAGKIQEAVGYRFPLRVESIPGDVRRLQGHLTLSDGSPLTIDVTPRGVMPIAEWLPYVFAVQMALLVICTWFAVRQAIRPLGDLAAAADALDPNRKGPPLRHGPSTPCATGSPIISRNGCRFSPPSPTISRRRSPACGCAPTWPTIRPRGTSWCMTSARSSGWCRTA